MDADKLIVDNMGLVYSQLHKFNRAYDDEAFSYAMEALMKAARTYDDTKNIKFSTYASVCIYNGIAHYLRKVRKEEQVELVSYDRPLADDSEFMLSDLIGSDDTPEKALLSKELLQKVHEVILKVLSETTNKNAVRAIEYWWSTDFTAQQSDIAAYAGVTQPTASRYISAFKYKVKLELEGYINQ